MTDGVPTGPAGPSPSGPAGPGPSGPAGPSPQPSGPFKDDDLLAVADAVGITTPARRSATEGIAAAPSAASATGGPVPITPAVSGRADGRVAGKGGAATQTCGHCLKPARGYARAEGARLCHPDEGLDCYRLVTVYGHSVPCGDCSPAGAAAFTLPPTPELSFVFEFDVCGGLDVDEPGPAHCGSDVPHRWHDLLNP